MIEKEYLSDTEQEKKHFEETVQIVKEQIEEYGERHKNLYKSFSQKADDPYVIEHLGKVYVKKVQELTKSLSNPYFARIDFQEEGKSDEPSELYIGRCSVMKDNADLQVIDWRTPVASLYYDGRLGDVSYEAPQGEIKGNLSLKRVFEVDNGELKSFSDVDITSNDELLKPYLSASSDNRLKNIISTIQSEQNKIIRAKLGKPLIVQGVAGSGKTTVALHRIAYLAYAYEKKLKSEDFLIIAPNKFFLDYISATLPDLGVDDVAQLTFEDFAKSLLGKGIKVESSNVKLADIVNNGKSTDDIEQRMSNFKSSLEYKSLLDTYLHQIHFGYFPDEDLKVGDIVILTKDKLWENFNNQFFREETPIQERFKIFVKKLSTFIENNQDQIESLIRNRRTTEIQKIDKSISNEEQKKQRIEIFDKYDPWLKRLDKGGKKLLAEYSKKAGKKTSLEIYKDFVRQLDTMQADIPKDIITQIQRKLLSKPNNKDVEYEDLAPLMYIEHKLKGSDIAKNAKCIVIDEAQDYSEFQFATLTDILQNNNITILGDIAQGIYSYRGVSDWNRINSEIFGGDAEILELKKSYRTTIEIMETGNDVIDKIKNEISINLAEPVIRSGKPVSVSKSTNQNLDMTIYNRVQELLSEDRKNIAVITKTLEEAKALYKKISKFQSDVTLISDKSENYSGGVSIIPSYLSKGLEFDSVIIYDANKINYANNELDAKLLYIAITRAMHTLDIFFTGEETELLNKREKRLIVEKGEKILNEK